MLGTRRDKDFTPEKKQLIAQFLISSCTKVKIQRGKINEAAASFGVCRRTIQGVWATAKKGINESIPVLFKSNRLGVPNKVKSVLDVELMKTIPFKKRSTIRRLAHELSVSKSHVGRWVKCMEIIPHTNAVKPTLTAQNIVQRLKWSLHAFQMDSQSQTIKFKSMHNIIHIDEKFFYMSRASERTYKAPREIEEYRTCKSKRFIPKVMFMCVVARPHYSSDGELIFYGKIGIFPFAKREPTQRNNINRRAGTMVTKPIDSINKEVMRDCLLHKIIPAIKVKWPPNASKEIFIQQDNARPHILNNEAEFRAAASSDGWNIQLICQPPNSPDTNINDLGFFRAIQSLQVDTTSYNVENVITAHDNQVHEKINYVFLSLQTCLIEVMKLKGGNNYKLPHMAKQHLINEGILPKTLEVDEALVRECIQHLIDGGHIEGRSYDLTSLMLSLDYHYGILEEDFLFKYVYSLIME